MPTKDAICSTMARVLAEAGVLSCRSNGLLEPARLTVLGQPPTLWLPNKLTTRRTV